MIRQGDVVLRRVDALPEEATRRASEGPVVLARGEATGHAHAIEEGGALYRHEERLYLVLEQEARLTHEEHGPISIEPGVWEVLRQRSFEPEWNRLVGD